MKKIEKALAIIDEEGLEKFSSKLMTTDCESKDKKFMTFLTKKEHKKYEITERFADQVILRKTMKNYMHLFASFGMGNHIVEEEEQETFVSITKLFVNIEKIFQNKLDDVGTNLLMKKSFELTKKVVEFSNYGKYCEIYNKPREIHVEIKQIKKLPKVEKDELRSMLKQTQEILNGQNKKGEYDGKGKKNFGNGDRIVVL